MGVVTSSICHGGGSPSYFWNSARWGTFPLMVSGDKSLGKGKSSAQAEGASVPHLCWHTEAIWIPGGVGHRTSPQSSAKQTCPGAAHFRRYQTSQSPFPLPASCTPEAQLVTGARPQRPPDPELRGLPDLAAPLLSTASSPACQQGQPERITLPLA